MINNTNKTVREIIEENKGKEIHLLSGNLGRTSTIGN